MKCQAKDWDKVFTNYQYTADKKQFLKYIKSLKIQHKKDNNPRKQAKKKCKDVSPKRIFRWQINTSKNIQYR